MAENGEQPPTPENPNPENSGISPEDIELIAKLEEDSKNPMAPNEPSEQDEEYLKRIAKFTPTADIRQRPPRFHKPQK